MTQRAEVERVVAAAVQWHGVTLTLPAPARHHTIFNQIGANVVHNMPQKYWPHWGPQGFITNTGRFVNRADAKCIALAAGQPMLLADHARHEDLFSEDLW